MSQFGGGDTSSERFSEYKVTDWKVSRKDFFYSCCPDEVTTPRPGGDRLCFGATTLILGRPLSDRLPLHVDMTKQPWPIIKFTFTLSRASAFYVRALVMPVIFLTVLSFGAPFFDVKTGERLGYGVSGRPVS